ncbi:hypothetical protein AAW14_34680 [Streptomyces hygroscopicus]|nr:hypothetical protein [Streptomyces hygroscopicus]
MRRQRTPLAGRIRRTWERLTSMPRSRAAAVSVFNVHSEGPDSSAAHISFDGCTSGRPSGVCLTIAMIRERSASVILRLRPCPPSSSRASSPERLKRCSRQRTVF